MRYSKRFEVTLPLERIELCNVDLQEFCSRSFVKEYAYILHKDVEHPHYHLYVELDRKFSDVDLVVALKLPISDGGKMVWGLCFVDLLGRTSTKQILTYFMKGYSITDLVTNIDLCALFTDLLVK
ncbi:MAG: hypothetical protein IJD47_01635 [Clostridia bacterium]|nr:hypothetical protein [Clostridia bacterium]MBQ3041877.1 hypothetical protein [Clostridia bacterium]